MEPAWQIRSVETPFHLGVLGDFSGRSDRVGPDAETSRRPIRVDRDNIRQVMSRLAPGCEASLGDADGHVVSLRFTSMEDFHPDRLFQAVPLLDRFRQLREKLLSPVTFEEGAAEVRAWGLLKHNEPVKPPQPAVAEPPPRSAASLLEQAISQTPPAVESRRPAPLPGDLAELVRRAAEPYRLAKPAPDQADVIACVDTVVGRLIRSVLHDPRFQAVEAAWRGLDFLVRRLPTGPRLKVFLVDVSLPELAADLGAAQNIESSGIWRLLVEQTVGTPGGQPWGALLGNYAFGATTADLLLAGCLAKIAAGAGAPFLAGGSPRLFGCESLVATPDPADWRAELPEKVGHAWEQVRSLPEAASLGLALPRFLLRMPYGPNGSRVESFAFEELPDPAEHESYLWGNPAFAGGYLLGQAFHERGWQMRPQNAMEIDDLPVYAYERDGEYEVYPCAETLLSERTAERILAAGLLPLLSIKGSGAARLLAWRSVAASGEGLAGA